MTDTNKNTSIWNELSVENKRKLLRCIRLGSKRADNHTTGKVS
jgi:hypothetical protein